MLTKTVKNGKLNQVISPGVMGSILAELRLLRKEVFLLLPQEDLEEYSDGPRIKKSYLKAIKKYPSLIS